MMNEREERTAAASDGVHAAEAETLDGLQAQLDEERNRAEGFRQSWMREAADFRNYKRRTEEQTAKNAMFANTSLLMNVIPVHDDLDRALENVDGSIAGSKWVEGIQLIARKFQGALDAAGVKEIAAEGADFDPNQHEAIAQAPGPSGKVLKVVTKGYTMGDRVLRAAQVIVGQGG